MAEFLTWDTLAGFKRGEVPLFAYGTLRPGEVLADIIDVTGHEPGVVHGYALYANVVDQYPIMAITRGHSVKGDLLFVENNERLFSTALMEVRAGYKLATCSVYTDLMEEPVTALTFLYPTIHIGRAIIESGDWKDRALIGA